ncbi:FAR1-related sequence 5-like protein, partial [Tanacetum coccineum]
MRTPRATLYETHETPRGSIYWEPHVEGIPIPVEGTYYDTIDEALDMYTKYAKIAGFEIKKGGQRLTKSGAVQHKYIYCNKEGIPKGINVDTLDPEYSDKQKRNTTTHVTGESDAQMLINKMENRKMYVPNFTFQYRVENSELVAMFWADEVAKCNYKEFGDILSFDATFNNKFHLNLIESLEISLESLEIPLESHEIPLESRVILLESHVILLLSQ